MLGTETGKTRKGAQPMTTAQVDEVLHDVMADRVGERLELVMKALNKRGITHFGGPVQSVHKHGFVLGDHPHRIFVTFSDLFCQAAKVVDGAPKESLTAAVRQLRGSVPAAVVGPVGAAD